MRKLMLLMTFLFVGIGLATAQVKVTGTVISSEDGEPVVGASILVKGTTIGTITDMDGNFSMSNVPSSAKTLVVSYIGMKTLDVTIKTGKMNITLESDSETLDEVIVVAYGTAKKNSFTGSASTVGAQSLEKRVLTNATSAIEGNASGVQVTAATGQPGEASNIRIRGFGSANASNAPLYVVDGAVFNGEISDINPADIESMTILKDAASTSLYGSSAGNGVVLITTKKGKGTSGTNFNLQINQGWSTRAYKDYAKVNIWQYYPLQWQMMKNSYITSGKSASEAASLASAEICVGKKGLNYNPFVGIADTEIVTTDGVLNPNAKSLKWGDDLDWEDAAYRTGYRQEYNLSYNTKTEKSDTYASVGYLKDNGYMIKTDFERYSGRLNYNVYPNKYFKTGLNVGLTRTISNYSTSTKSSSNSYSNLTGYVRKMAPIYPVHKHDLQTGAYLDATGSPTTDPSQYVYDYEGKRLSNFGRDAVAETELNNRELTRMAQTGRTYLTITPIEGLNITSNYAIENQDYRHKVYENPYVGDGTAGPGRLKIRSTRKLTQTFNQLVSYNKNFGSHTIDALVGHENFAYKYEYLDGMRTQEIVSGIHDFSNFVKISSMDSYTHNYKKEGYFGRLNYDYAGKYYASLSYRHDGSSRFSKDNRWGNFWSFGASWRISEENFMKDVKWVNNLKVRASYGETGNDAIQNKDEEQSYYPYQNLFGLGFTNGTEDGVFFKTISNTNLKWETQVSTDFAIEFGLFDCLTGSIEYFRKDSRDLLFNLSQPTSTGVSSIISNVGKLSNSGVEIALDYNVFKNKDWNVTVGANATFLKNEIKKLPESMKDGYVNGSKRWLEGKSIYEFWLRQWYGVNPANGDGLYYLDTDKYNKENNTLSASVQETIVEIDGKQLTNNYAYAKYDFSGSSIPKVFGGFNFKVSYKSFDLAATFSYQLGGKLIDTNYRSMMDMASFGYAMSTDVLKAWQKEGDQTDVPRLDNNSTHATNIGQSYSSRWLTSSDYLNLRSVSLGYEFPKNLVSKIMLKSARLNLTAENLFMLKARQGLNPMGQYNGLTYNEYLPTRNFTLGLNVSF